MCAYGGGPTGPHLFSLTSESGSFKIDENEFNVKGFLKKNCQRCLLTHCLIIKLNVQYVVCTKLITCNNTITQFTLPAGIWRTTNETSIKYSEHWVM